MPIYIYKCEQCGSTPEVMHSIDGESPLCCAKPMLKLPTLPAIIKVEHQGNRVLSKGYKEGYVREYQKSLEA